MDQDYKGNTEKTIVDNEEGEPQTVNQSSRLGFDFNKHFLPISILAAAVLISGSLLYSGSGNSAGGSGDEAVQGRNRVALEDSYEDSDHGLGNKDAKVVIVEFSDYQCPFCRAFWTSTLPQLKETYIDTGKVYFVYRDFPLNIHAMAQTSALAAECASEEGKYWEYHDKIFQEQNNLESTPGRFSTVQYTEKDLIDWAGQIGINTQNFSSCLKSGKYNEEVAKDFNDGSALGVNGTPGFLVNGRLISGAQPFNVFQSMIEEELNK